MNKLCLTACVLILPLLALSFQAFAHDENVKPGPTQFHAVTPIILVSDLDASIGYYTGVLGFTHDWSDPPEGEADFASVSNGAIQVFLTTDGQGEGTSWNYFIVADVDALHQQYVESGADIVQPPEDKRWGMREMVVRDPDGNVLRIGMGIGEEAEHDHEHDHAEGEHEH